MTRRGAAKRIAAAAAMGGGGLGVLAGASIGLIFTQAKYARRTIGHTSDDPPVADGLHGTVYETGPDGPVRPLVLAMLGDSTACGYGVARPEDTPGAVLARGLADAARRPVHLVTVAKVGGRSADLDGQIEKMLTLGEPQAAPDVAVMMVGANDVTNRVKVPEAVDLLDASVRRLRALGAEVVVGTCPDLGTIEPVAPPLRWIARRWSRQLAAAQTITVVEAGGRTVSMGTLLGPEFAARPADMFGPDRFHPSAVGYARAVAVMLPSVAASLGLETDGVADLDHERGERMLPVARAAVRAAASGGSEVAGALVVDEDRRRDRRLSAVGAGWALLRRRH